MRGDLATWCRILAVGPPCEHACADCRSRPIPMSALRSSRDDEPAGDGAEPLAAEEQA